jgi:hypothetical protein
MKKNKKEHIILSDTAYYKYYDQGNFISLFASSFLHSGRSTVIVAAASFLLGCFCFLFVKISYINQPREFVSAVCTGMTTYSITTIGFLLVAFTLLVVLNDSKSSFSFFVIEDSKYKKPLLKVLLNIFIVPIGVFSLLLMVSMLTNFMIPVFGIHQFTYAGKNLIFKIFTGVFVFLFLFSTLEFFSFFHNIYKFIVIISYNTAKEFELDEINKLKVLDIKIYDDGRDKIIKNIKEKFETTRRENPGEAEV